MIKKLLDLDQIKGKNMFEQAYLCLGIGWWLLVPFMLLMSILVHLFLILIGTIYVLSSYFVTIGNYPRKVDYFADIYSSNMEEHIYAHIDFYGVFFLFYAMVTVTFYVFASTANTRTSPLKYNSKKVEIALCGTLVSFCLLLTGILFIEARDLAMENILPLLLLLLKIIPVRKKITLFADIIIPLFVFFSFIYGWLQEKSAWWGIQKVWFFLYDSLGGLFFLLFVYVILFIVSHEAKQTIKDRAD